MAGESKSPPEGVKIGDDGVWLVPILRGWTSRSDADAEAYLVAANRLTERGGWDHGMFELVMQTMIAEAAARGQADLDLVSVDSTTARAHHHAAGMALDGELAAALEEAAERGKGLRQRDKTPATAPSAMTGTADDGYAAGTGSG